jgi:hypothetical protein
MKKYRAVILVLASNNNQIYKNCRKIWKQYMNVDPSIKVFFVYGKIQPNNILEYYDPDSDIIFENIEESYPVLIQKTIEAFKIIKTKIEFDFLIRTNLSTFWDFNKLHLHLNDLPVTNCYSGDGPLPNYNAQGYYLSGTDTIVTPEMINSIILNEHKVDFQTVEDAAMGKYFHGVFGAPMLPNRICFFEDIYSNKEYDKIIERIDNAKQNNKDHYRVKSVCENREIIDYFIYQCLLKNIYNIEI